MNEQVKVNAEQFLLVLHDFTPEHVQDTPTETPRKKRKTEDSGQIPLRKGEVVKLGSKDQSGWWWGQVYCTATRELVGAEGWFPSNHTKNYYTVLPQRKPEELSGKDCYFFDDSGVHFKGLPLLENAKDMPDPFNKEIRLMNHFFDYEHWNDHMNKIDPASRKGRPNRKLKKEKKIRW